MSIPQQHRLFWLAAIALVLEMACGLMRSDDKKKNSQSYYVKPGQTVDLEVPKLATAREKCENWAMAAGLESILEQQGIPLDQSFWVQRLSGGEICRPEIPSLDALTDVVNREFVLDDGRHIRLELVVVSGAPTDTDALISSLKRQQLS